MTGASWWRRPFVRAWQFVALREELAAAAQLPPDRRAALARTAALAAQKRAAADALLAGTARAEPIRLAVEAAGLEVQLLDDLVGSGVLAGEGVQAPRDALERAVAQLSSPPALDAEVTGTQTGALRALLRAALALEARIRESLYARPALLRLRAERAVAAALVLSSPLALALFVRGSFLGLTARASSTLDDQYAADRVLDGDPDTEWVAGSGEEWLEIRFRPRRVQSVRILNGDTLPDRAVKEVHVDCFEKADSRSSAPLTWKTEHPPQWQTADVGGNTCDRIRIVVTSHFGPGAAIAEVEVE